MNRRLVKPFFNKFLKLKLTEVAQQIAGKIKRIPMDNKDELTQYDKNKTGTILKEKNAVKNKKDAEKKSKYISTHSFQENCKESTFLREKLMINSQKDGLRYYSHVPNFHVGDEATLEKIITEEDVRKFIDLSGDSNPIHLSHKNHKGIVHGALLNSLVSNVIGTKLPGPGTVVIKQTLNFPNKCYIGEVVKVNVRVTEVRKIVRVEFKCKVEEKEGPGRVVLFGEAQLIHKGTDKEEQLKPRGL